MDGDLNTTVLNGLHRELGGRMVGFAGYEMPVQFEGVMAEHHHCRAAAGLFDVSHMGQVLLKGPEAAAALERLVPQAVTGLAEGRQRYGFFTNEAGGLLDDLMIAARPGELLVVVNAACAEADLAHMRAGLGGDVDIVTVTDRALLAVQGPKAVAAVARLVPGVEAMAFMDHRVMPSDYGEMWISRSGYTGEDGLEISVAADRAESFARDLLAMEEVLPIGLGARDSLRLEAGLCLYGSDIGPDTSPIEADLAWAIQKRRRLAGDFPGAARILRDLADGPARRRVGLLPEGRGPMRAGVPLFAGREDSAPIGEVTSGAFGPSVERPISMGYVSTDYASAGTRLYGEVRGKRLAVEVAAMPFQPHRYHR